MTLVAIEQPAAAPPLDNPPPPAPRSRWSWLRTLALVLPPVALTLVLTVVGIGTRSLWNDEYATWYAATLSFGDLLRLIGNVDAVVAPYYLVMHGWIAVFGESAASLRMPSALAMAAAAALTALVGRRLFDSGVGLTAGLLLAGLPAVSRYGQEARPYSFAILLATLATLLLLRAVERPIWRRWFIYGLCLIGAGLVHIVTLTILLAHALYMWHAFRKRGDFRLIRWAAGAAIAITGSLPLVAEGRDQSSAIDWIQLNGTAITQLPERIFGSAVVAAVVTGSAALAGILLWRRSRGPVLLLAAWAVFPPVFCLATFPVLHLFLHRYLLFTLPGWALLAAAAGFAVVRAAGRWSLPKPGPTDGWSLPKPGPTDGGVALPKPGPTDGGVALPESGPTGGGVAVAEAGPGGGGAAAVALSLVGLLVVAAVFYVGAPGQEAARHSPVVGEPDFRGAARSVEGRRQPGDAIAFAGAGRNGRRAFAYETRLATAKPTDILVARTSQQIGQFGTLECADPGRCVGNTQRMWLITATENYEDPLTGMTETIQAYLNSAFTFTEIQSFEHVRIFLLTRKA